MTLAPTPLRPPPPPVSLVGEIPRPGYARQTVARLLYDKEASREAQSAAWLSALRGGGVERERAVAELHGLLLRIARREAGRRARRLQISGPELDDLAHQAAADALLALRPQARRVSR